MHEASEPSFESTENVDMDFSDPPLRDLLSIALIITGP